MAIALTVIFGSEINVTPQPRQVERQYAGFAGAEGVTAMHMGSRGYQLVISGRLRAATRAPLQAGIDAINSYCWSAAGDYSHGGITYSWVVFDKMEISRDGRGKGFHLLGSGWVTCEFTMYARALV